MTEKNNTSANKIILEHEEQVALRKLVSRLAGWDPDETWPEDYTVFDAVEDGLERIQRLEALEERVEEIEVTAQSAIGVAQAKGRADGGSTKKETALRNTRNELVRRTLMDRSNSAGSHVTVGEVKNLCKPEVVVYQQTVEDAWDELVTRWACFEHTTNEDGNKACKIDHSDLTQELVGAVENDLDRDDLSKRLLSRRGSTA